jgi:hypothetical protein
MSKLILNKEMNIVQHQGKTYNYPSKINLRTDAINKYNAFSKIQLLAGELGLEMYEDGIGCSDCKYTGMFEQSLKNLNNGQRISKFSNPKELCKYDNNDEPQWLSYFYREGNIIKNIFGEIGFAARFDPCVADTALLRVLIELNFFNKYEVQTNLDVKIFPYIREVNQNNEKKFVKLYKEHFKN